MRGFVQALGQTMAPPPGMRVAVRTRPVFETTTAFGVLRPRASQTVKVVLVPEARPFGR